MQFWTIRQWYQNGPRAHDACKIAQGATKAPCCLPMTSCHRRDNGEFITALDRCLFSGQKTDIFIMRHK